MSKTYFKGAKKIVGGGSSSLRPPGYGPGSKLATQTHHLHYPLQERHFPTPLHHAEKQQLHGN